MADQTEKRNTLVHEARAKAQKKANCFRRVFNTPDGKIVLAELKEEFEYKSINVPGDSHGTHVRVGELNVIGYIQQLMEIEDA